MSALDAIIAMLGDLFFSLFDRMIDHLRCVVR